MEGLAAYYQSPGKLAGLRRRFESAFRQPGLDPATFATDLGMLAIQGFGDMREQARDTMIRDKFIAGQEQCALRRQFDGFAQGTPIWEIVDSCRVWESHSNLNWIAKTGYDSEIGNQSGDARTQARKIVGVVMEDREPEIEDRRKTQKLCEMLWQDANTNVESPTGVGMVNLKTGFLYGTRVKHMMAGNGDGRWKRTKVREGGSASRTSEDQSSIDPGGGVPSRLKKGCPLGRRRKMMGVAAEGRWMIGNSQSGGRRGRPGRSPDRPILLTPRGTGDQADTRYRSPGVWTGECDRRGTFGRFGRGTVMFGRGVSRNP